MAQPAGQPPGAPTQTLQSYSNAVKNSFQASLKKGQDLYQKAVTRGDIKKIENIDQSFYEPNMTDMYDKRVFIKMEPNFYYLNVVDYSFSTWFTGLVLAVCCFYCVYKINIYIDELFVSDDINNYETSQAGQQLVQRVAVKQLAASRRPSRRESKLTKQNQPILSYSYLGSILSLNLFFLFSGFTLLFISCYHGFFYTVKQEVYEYFWLLSPIATLSFLSIMVFVSFNFGKKTFDSYLWLSLILGLIGFFMKILEIKGKRRSQESQNSGQKFNLINFLLIFPQEVNFIIALLLNCLLTFLANIKQQPEIKINWLFWYTGLGLSTIFSIFYAFIRKFCILPKAYEQTPCPFPDHFNHNAVLNIVMCVCALLMSSAFLPESNVFAYKAIVDKEDLREVYDKAYGTYSEIKSTGKRKIKKRRKKLPILRQDSREDTREGGATLM